MTVYTKSPAWTRAVDTNEPLTTLIPNYQPTGTPSEVNRVWRFHDMAGVYLSAQFTNNAVAGDLIVTLPNGLAFNTDHYGITGEEVTHYPPVGTINAVTTQGGGRYGVGSAYLLDSTHIVLVINGEPVGPGNPGNWNSGGSFEMLVEGIAVVQWEPREDHPETP